MVDEITRKSGWRSIRRHLDLDASLRKGPGGVIYDILRPFNCRVEYDAAPPGPWSADCGAVLGEVQCRDETRKRDISLYSVSQYLYLYILYSVLVRDEYGERGER
ncbi:hypothetical protein V9T40_009873 [Parthenolecanium corni]|uniref:Uncharacterized protein n=1 Tax=Parthenolecanium corni TaxID=536013 RepID=A0AAN9TKF4_9HEMI